jgi:hypothetical protein
MWSFESIITLPHPKDKRPSTLLSRGPAAWAMARTIEEVCDTHCR